MKVLSHTAILVLSFILLACQQGRVMNNASKQQSVNPLEQIMNDYWQQRLDTDPQLAQNVGDKRHDDKLADLSDAGFQARKALYLSYQNKLSVIDLTSLDKQDLVNHRVLSWIVNHELQLLDSPWQYYRFDSYQGWHSSFAQEMAIAPLKTAQDFDNYLARLAGFNAYTQQNISLLRRGIKAGHVQPCATLDGYLASIQAYIKAPEDSALFAPFMLIDLKLAASNKASLKRRAKALIEDVVNPAYQRYAEFFESEYLPACQQQIAITERPGGADLYELFVKYYTSTDMNAAEVHQLGLSEVARIRAKMAEVQAEVGFNGEFSDFLQELRSNKKFYPENKESYLRYAAFLSKKVDGKLPEYFSYLPRNPYGIKEIPTEIAAKTSTAYYQHGASDGSRAGTYYINTYDLASRPLYELPALTLHESVPGHHLQISIQNEMQSLPSFRRHYYFHAFGEGWGLYSEFLGEEMGMYPTAYDRFGRLTYEMWRACRLVVDTGMHTKGWSRQQAIDYMANNSALSIHNITTEVDRYISWPGQALAYKIGELKIRELRRAAEAKLGLGFSLRDFHQQVLNNGALPLSVLQQNIEDWVVDQE